MLDLIPCGYRNFGDDPGDETIMRRAFEGGMILVTADKDFGKVG